MCIASATTPLGTRCHRRQTRPVAIVGRHPNAPHTIKHLERVATTMCSAHTTRLLFVALSVVAATGCLEAPSVADGEKGTPLDMKAEALEFSLGIVQTYLAQDYATFRGALAERIFTLDGEGPYTREDIDSWFAEARPFPAGRDYSAHSLEEYLDVYAPRMMTFDEAREEHPELAQITWEGWTPDKDDQIFLGWETKPGKEPFMWDDLLAFVVTKELGEWRFKAFSG